ncbi:MAG: hypothetical protein ACE5JN_01420 [Candidatus Methylomirabilia bacterium]
MLSYYVAPKVNVPGAEAAVKAAHQAGGRPCRIVRTQLYFIPYYRLTGHDFQWRAAPRKPRQNQIYLPSYPAAGEEWAPGGVAGDFVSTVQWVGDLVTTVFASGGKAEFKSRREPESPRQAQPSASVGKSNRVGIGLLQNNEEVLFRDRYVEKNFLACQLHGLDLYSLGVRPAVVRLELFRREVLRATGRIVKGDITPEAALAQGMKTAGAHSILYRTVIGRILSLIYFPFWVVEVEYRGHSLLAVLDGVSKNVIKLDAPLSFYARLDNEAVGDPQTIGFRPLTCPNCGWDLPVKPDDVIFVCSSCDKVWQIHRSDLYEVQYEIARRASSEQKQPAKYLPFWVLQAEMGEDLPVRFFLPAFRYRRLKFLSNLARNISKRQPSYVVLAGERPDLHGCYYDLEDAILLAQFTYAGLTSRKLGGMRSSPNSKLPMTGGTLTWFPFKLEGNALRDPFTGTALPQNLLL